MIDSRISIFVWALSATTVIQFLSAAVISNSLRLQLHTFTEYKAENTINYFSNDV